MNVSIKNVKSDNKLYKMKRFNVLTQQIMSIGMKICVEKYEMSAKYTIDSPTAKSQNGVDSLHTVTWLFIQILVMSEKRQQGSVNETLCWIGTIKMFETNIV